MKDPKLAAIKLTTSEEIICYVVDMIDHGSSKTIVIRDPLKVEYREITTRSVRKRKAYSLSPWFILSKDREYELDLDIILGISAVHDDEIRDEYTKHFIKNLQPSDNTNIPSAGYLGSVENNKKLLEKLFRADSADKTE